MNAEEFRELVRISIDWDHEISIEKCDDIDYSYSVTLTLWGKTITDEFHTFGMRWFSEGSNGIMVDTPLTVWQWVAMRFADQIGGNVE